MPTIQRKKICAGYEPVPGYVLEEVIGRGGFGEVWRSSAPGGLKKAIKFVFGNQDQSRATREMRSLERVKGVHHPFLLTLERFEVIDDQLIIITELADGSLEDVFKRHRDNGSCGIPRDVLLSHLHDTADGLDYLHQSYQLQHLDIKPGNLLIIGGHVKVADFGLLKDLRDIDCSVVGGLTPIYAPPEVFDGRPSLHSDQYSLAVMFQELLTGTRPFSGRTIAQLATQHVHSAPNLEALPPSDRPVIARALEKNPNRRFPSCKAFVEALRNHRDRLSQIQSQFVDDDAHDTEDGVVTPGASVEDLPQIAEGSSNRKGVLAQHALVIGLGGTGAECVRELRHRIAELHIASPLHLHSMVIDTDLSTIHTLRLGEVSDRVPKCNSVYTPLRTAHEYRDAGTNRLKSISRRWIYNVPRSGSTEGMRPLGRLALVDHGKMVKDRLIQSIEEMVAECGSVPPKIYVVGSLAGGTGSGMYIDIVHLLRSMLDESGLEEVRILSLLSSVGFQIDHSNPLALHDAQAALNEIEFFMQVGNGYPGDEGAGWPSVPAARTPLRDLYLICASSADQLASNPIETITEYIWGDSTGCGDLLAAARRYEQSDSPSIRKPSIRSVGVIPLGDRHGVETRVLSPAVVRELLTRWLGVPSKARKASPDLADRFERRLSLSLQHTIETLTDHLDMKALPNPTVGGIEKVVADRVKNGNYDWVSAGWLNNIYREISVCLNDRRADVSTVFESLKLLNDRCLEWSRDAMQSAPSPVGAEETVVADAIYIDAIVKRLSAHQLEQFASGLTFLEERLERLAAILAVGVVDTKNEMGDFNPWDSMPEVVRKQFDGVVKQLHSDTVGQCLIRPMNDLGANLDSRSLIFELTELTVPIVVDMVERHSAEVAKARVGVLNVEQPDQATTSLTNTAPQSAINRTAQTHEVTMANQPRVASGPMSIDDAIVCVKPALLSLGGLQRLILVVGSEVERTQLEPQVRAIHPGSLTVAVIPNTEPKLIHEAQKIELKNVMSRLAVLNGANEQVTSRLASRVDVAF
ncbi:protein kinase domain-containing protein [Rubripirellula reticaptiva]|uniref:Tubulin-like protein n=1 Tax=Rubripirellula reticaptiva TaxID=2528013 RepID=A0A5C6EV06_9BACT|nr:tubulin-like doman-containing protein [Rubripirellula reticaptiva]TWU51887.1 Tubulin-like protein [Rubripirellula reticaptiva]